MITVHASAPHPFTVGDAFLLRPRYVAQKPDAWEVHVSAADLVGLVQGPDAVRRLGARRGFLGDTSVNRELAAVLRHAPEEFGWARPLVLGAEEIHVSGPFGPDGFPSALLVSGLECIDGFQRLGVIAEAARMLGPAHLARATVRLEIRCGRSREAARRHFDEAHDRVNATTARDGLIRCPNIRRLMARNWEAVGFFDPRRGVSPGSRRRPFVMPEVTRALACLSPGEDPEATHVASTDDGLERLWAERGSALYLGVFHDRMSPLGVVRAVTAYTGARQALAGLWPRPKGTQYLVRYAPDLVCRVACRRLLPVAELHEEGRTAYDWDGQIRASLPGVVRATAEALVARYQDVRRARGSERANYVDEAGRLDVWREILG
ncbi:hypothetical protein [Streptomyces sp. NPDC048266]|uniref:hypothetical protein n=1 Tax=Streptomyces sp. NPDC048266 TaxID=3155787 RepID=UPI0033EA07C1